MQDVVKDKKKTRGIKRWEEKNIKIEIFANIQLTPFLYIC